MNEWNKERLINLLQTNNRAVEKAIVAIYHRQTLDEQSTQETKHANGIGFTGAHARLGTYYARWLLAGNSLTGKHLEKARAMSLHYTAQLLQEISNKSK